MKQTITLLLSAILLICSLTACGNRRQEMAGSNILIVYFSRYGNTEYPDNVEATTSASIVAYDTVFIYILISTIKIWR